MLDSSLALSAAPDTFVFNLETGYQFKETLNCEIVFEIDMGLFHTKVQRQLLKNMNEGTEDLCTELIQQYAVAIEKL